MIVPAARGLAVLTLGLTLLVAAGCDLDYGKDQATASDQVPQMVFSGIHQTSVKDGRVQYTMDSDTSEVFQAKKQVRLKNFRFQEYDSEGQPASRGEADSAVVNSANNDARITGRLSARSEEQSVTLLVEGTDVSGVTWSNDNKILKTEPLSTVTLTKDDGSQIKARSLTLDMGANQMELEESVEGTWNPETKQDANTTAPTAQPVAPALSP